MDTVGVIELVVCQAALVAAGQSGFAQHLLVEEAVRGVGQAGLRGESGGSAAGVGPDRGHLQLLPVAARVQHGVELLQAEAAAVHVVRVHADHAGAGGGAAGEALQLGRHHLGSQPVRAAAGPEETGILLVGPGQGAVVEGREGAAARGVELGLGGEAAVRVGAEQPGRGRGAVQPARGQHVLLARPHRRCVRQRRAAGEQLARVGQGSS